MLNKSDYSFDLPLELIAQHPSEQRDGCRLLLLDKTTGEVADRVFSDLDDYLRPGDCLVLNDSRVLPARLIGVKSDSGIPVEFLLQKRISTTDWEIICKPGRRLKTGARAVFIPDELEAEVLEVMPDGNRIVRFIFDGIWEEVLERAGTMPLPPYIHEKLEDAERYQTVYAVHNGSSAAPTAGLHFTHEMLDRLQAKGIVLAYVTLHVGLGTFRPVKAENILEHHMHSEHYHLSEEACNKINEAKASGHRVICVGTTSCRVVESAGNEEGRVAPTEEDTEIFIYPGYRFKIMDGLITNFHLSESTLLMLVSAFAGRERVLAAYEHAVEERYMFFSFGDAMFIADGLIEREA